MSQNQRDALEETRNLFVLGAYLEIEANFWTFPTSFSFWPSAARLGWLESMESRADWTGCPPWPPSKSSSAVAALGSTAPLSDHCQRPDTFLEDDAGATTPDGDTLFSMLA